jgi:hypothetical protein
MTRAEIRQAEATVCVLVERILALDTESRKDLEIVINEIDSATDLPPRYIKEAEITLCELLWPEMIGNLRRRRSSREKR